LLRYNILVLLEATLLVDLSAMAITLWMAFYLVGKGFPSRITLRAVAVLLLVAIFFLGVYNSLFHETMGSVGLRAILVVVALGAWYDLTYQLMSVDSREKLRWIATGMYFFSGVAGVLMLGAPNAFTDVQANPLYVAHIASSFSTLVYLLYLFVISIGILYNLLVDKRIGLSSQGKYFLFASILIISAVCYGVGAVTSSTSWPRVIMDFLILSGVTALGISVARHQALIERRITIQDFPVSGLTILVFALLYAFLGLRWGIPSELIAALVATVIVSHSLYDLVREYLERQRIHKERSFRIHLRQLESESFDEQTLHVHLQEVLDILCQTLAASGGFIAVRRDETFIVIATRESLLAGSQIPGAEITCEDVTRSSSDHLPQINWIAPAFESETQVGIVGICQPKVRLDYNAADLDLLAEVAGQVGTMVSLNFLQSGKVGQIRQWVGELSTNASMLEQSADEIRATITTNPDPEFIKTLEEGLRHLPDYIALGQSALADWSGISGESYVERGKKLNGLLLDSIELLRPVGTRPSEPLPRVWFSYCVLYDAYVEGVPNREIMARLYISEGTFNRIRRSAIRGLARLLVEKQRTV
jgi:hypothetical protein